MMRSVSIIISRRADSQMHVAADDRWLASDYKAMPLPREIPNAE
jgi:hypothetical protein